MMKLLERYQKVIEWTLGIVLFLAVLAVVYLVVMTFIILFKILFN